MTATNLQLTFIFVLILLLATVALPCGAPHMITGRVHGLRTVAIVRLRDVGAPPELAQVARTNQFGYFAFPDGVGACPSEMRIDVTAKGVTFPATLFWTDGSGSLFFFDLSPIVRLP